MAKLDDLRVKIDEIDNEIVSLLKKRAEFVLGVKEAKREGNIDIYSPARERQILDRVIALAKDGHFPLASLESIFANIISATRSLIGELSVAFPGPETALSGVAAKKQFGDTVNYFPISSVEEVFNKVERGDMHYGVVPIETSSGGMELKTLEVLMQSNLQFIAEVDVLQHLSLFGTSAGLSEVQRVYSDVRTFAQCETWLRENLPAVERVVVDSTSQALTLLKDNKGAGVIAGSNVSPEGLQVLAQNVEDDAGANTRFIVIGSKMPNATGSDKTSLLCAVEDRAGALRDLLQPFSERGLTLLKIESKPLRSRSWEHLFFIEVSGHQSEEVLSAAIGELSNLCPYVKVLGSYPVAEAS